MLMNVPSGLVVEEKKRDDANHHLDSDGEGAEDQFQDAVDGLPSLTIEEPRAVEHDDTPPSFPLRDGPQVQRGKLGPSSDPPTFNAPQPPSFTVSGPKSSSTLAAPSSLATRTSKPTEKNAGSSSTSAKLSTLRDVLGVTRSTASGVSGCDGGLMPPPRTTASSAPAGVGGASGATLSARTLGSASSGGLLAPSGAHTASSGRNKVMLEPGYGPLDWARVKTTTDMRCGATSLRRISASELRQHTAPDDAWSAFQGKVYNLTPYLRFHPGGVKELMRVAGRDGTRLFMLTHSWVNIDSMIDACMLGFLVPDS